MARSATAQIRLVVQLASTLVAAGAGMTPDSAGAFLPCDDGNPCTTDGGHPPDCVHDFNNDPCNDGNACTTDDACSGGSCVGGTPVFCEAPSACYVPGTCDPISGECSEAQLIPDGGACAGSPCTITGTYSGGMRQGARPRCDDSDGCTDDSCNPSTGACTHTPKNCDDGSACTQDYCSIAYCYHSPLCTDTDPCTNDNCDPATGACTHTPNTGNTCGDDGDGNYCTSNRCVSGVCQPSSLPACDDLNPCTEDTCDNPQVGLCRHVVLLGYPCNDANPCTANDACGSTGCHGTPNSFMCNDNNPCTSDACDPSLGCVHQNLQNVTCEDGNGCTGPDTCSNGVCTPGPALNAPTEVTNVRF